MRTIALLLLPAALAACSTVEGGPTRPAFMDAEAAYINATYGGNAIPAYDALAGDDAARYRDKVIFARMSIIDRSYAEYKANLLANNSKKNFAVTAITMGLAGAAAVTGGAATKAALAAAVAGLTGLNAAYDREFLYAQTLIPLISSMDAERALIADEIRQKQASAAYTLYEAGADLERYYEAGTLAGAIVSLTEKTLVAGAAIRARVAASRLALIMRSAPPRPALRRRAAPAPAPK